MVHLVKDVSSHAGTVMETVLAIMLTEVAQVGAHQDGLGLCATKVSELEFYFKQHFNVIMHI